jgi:hypothetical protein
MLSRTGMHLLLEQDILMFDEDEVTSCRHSLLSASQTHCAKSQSFWASSVEGNGERACAEFGNWNSDNTSSIQVSIELHNPPNMPIMPAKATCECCPVGQIVTGTS